MSLIVKISADTSAFKRAVNTVSSDVQNFGKRIGKMGDAFKPVTYAAGGVFTAAIKSGMEFESVMSEVSAVGQIYGNELDALTEKAKQIGLTTKFTATEAAQGLVYMGQAGWTARESLEGIDAVMTLAAAGGLEVGRASDIVTDAITALGYKASDSAKFVDVLAVAAAKSNTNVDMMGETFKYAAPIAGTLGVNIEDLSLALGIMANSSIKGSIAGTSMRAGLINLAKPTRNMKVAMEKYGVALVTNKDGSVDLEATMRKLREAMKGLNETQKAAALGAIFGKTAMSGWAAIVNATDKDFNDLAEAINKSAGAGKLMQETMMDNTMGDMQIALSAVSGALLDVFEAISPCVTEIAKSVTELANKFSGLSDSTQMFIVKGIAIAGLVSPMLKLLGVVVKVGAKIAAVPVALKKMGRSGVEREVNSWLKWHKVTDDQAAKLRKLARDLDMVRRGGAGAENAAKRLDMALERANVPRDVVSDLKDIENQATAASGRMLTFNKTLGSMHVKGAKVKLGGKNFEVNAKEISNSIGRKLKVKGVKVDGDSIKVNKSSMAKTVKDSGVGSTIGKTMATDTVSTVTSVVGSTLGSSIGGVAGPVGALVGNIIGESAGTGLAAAMSSAGGFTSIFKSIPKILSPVGLGFAGITAAIGGFLYASRDIPASFNLMSESIDANGNSIRVFSETSAEANSILEKFSDNWMTIDANGNLKEFGVKVNIDYEEELKTKTAALESDLQGHFDARIEMIKNNNIFTEEEKNTLIAKEKERQGLLTGEVKSGLESQLQAQKDYNTKMGLEKYNAGLNMLKGDLEIAKKTELFYATSLDDRLAIEKKYEEKFKEAKGKYIEDNYQAIMDSFRLEAQLIAENRSSKLQQLEEDSRKEIEVIKKTYKEGSYEYNRAMDSQYQSYLSRKDKILIASDEELQASKDRAAQYVDEVNDMERNGKISREVAKNIFDQWSELSRAEFTMSAAMDISDVEIDKLELLKIKEEFDGKEICTKLNLDKLPFDQGMINAKIEAANLDGTKIEPTLDLRRSPFYDAVESSKEDMEELDEEEAKPYVDLAAEQFDEKINGVMNRLTGLKTDETHCKINADKTDFELKCDEAEKELEQMNLKRAIPIVALNLAEFALKRDLVDEDLRIIGSKKPTPEVDMNSTDFNQGKTTVDSMIAALNASKITIGTTMDTSGAMNGHWRLKNWIANNPIIQGVHSWFSGSSDHRATGGQIGSGTTVVGERGPELVSRRGNSVTVQPLRATDRAMGGWSEKDLAGGSNDVYNITIVGANKTAKELFDEIEEYKSNISRNKGTRRF